MYDHHDNGDDDFVDDVLDVDDDDQDDVDVPYGIDDDDDDDNVNVHDDDAYHNTFGYRLILMELKCS